MLFSRDVQIELISQGVPSPGGVKQRWDGKNKSSYTYAWLSRAYLALVTRRLSCLIQGAVGGGGLINRRPVRPTWQCENISRSQIFLPLWVRDFVTADGRRSCGSSSQHTFFLAQATNYGLRRLRCLAVFLVKSCDACCIASRAGLLAIAGFLLFYPQFSSDRVNSKSVVWGSWRAIASLKLFRSNALTPPPIKSWHQAPLTLSDKQEIIIYPATGHIDR